MPADRSFHAIEIVADRLEGAPERGRRRWSDEFKVRLVEQTLAPGANVSAIARQAGISPAQLFGWRRQAIHSGTVRPLKAEAAPHFVAVEATAPSVIEIVIGNIVVRADAAVAEEHLRRVIRAVRLA